MTKFLLTMQFNEVLLLPVFLTHYAKYFSPREIFVIDHGSTEHPSLDPGKPYNTIRVPRDRPFSEMSRIRLISHVAAGLLEYFDAGVYADCDELISFDDFDERDLAQSPVIYVAGFDVFHDETPAGRRLLGMLHPRECKPLIFRTLPRWGLGFHGCDHPPARLTLPLAHIRYLHKEESARRLQQRVAVHTGMNDDERTRGVDVHWSQGDAAYRRFETRVAEYRATGAAPVKFEPVDPAPFFTKSIRNPDGATGRESYSANATMGGALRPVVDLTDHFGTLI